MAKIESLHQVLSRNAVRKEVNCTSDKPPRRQAVHVAAGPRPSGKGALSRRPSSLMKRRWKRASMILVAARKRSPSR